MNTKRLLFGLIGLMLGFIVSFIWTRDYNKRNAVSSSTSGATAAGAPGGDNQKAMMGQIKEVMDRAKQNPKDFNAQIAAASAYDSIGRTKEAVEYLIKAIEVNPRDEQAAGICGYIAKYYFDQKAYPDAEKWFRRVSEINPSIPDAYVEVGATYIERQPPNPDKAIVEIQRALNLDPKNAHALEHLTEAYALKKDVRGADDAISRLKQAEPGNTRLPQLQNMVSDLKAGKAVSVPKE
ncbi:MAG TPA: tetratricopeptide repeat protein [Blastocatellia bacterium]|nr:tetratricopeptide repeat protein [Blastocatellia bacterium]